MKNVHNFNNFLNESSGRLVQVALDLDLDNDGMMCLQELIEQFNLQIINLFPLGPGGGSAKVTFRGESKNILDMLDWYSELTGEDAGSYYDTYVRPDAPIPFEVQSNSRMVTFRNRKYVGVDGKPLMK